MGDKTVNISDLSGEYILDDGQVAVLTILKHPALTDGPVTLEAALSELRTLEKHSIDVCIVDVTVDGETKRHMMLVNNFDGLAKNGDMAHILAAAVPVKAPRPGPKPAGEKVDYTAPDKYGQVHRGKITEEEARLVRENPEQATRNRQAQGHPAIDWTDPKEIARYGLTTEPAYS